MKTMTIVGRVTRDAKVEKRTVGKDEVSVCNFNVAVNTATRKKDEKGNRLYKTDFYQVSLWRQQADSMAPYLYQGRMVAVTGDFELDTYQSKKDKTIHAYAHFTSPTIELLGKNEAKEEEPAPAAETAPVAEFDPEEDELPFN